MYEVKLTDGRRVRKHADHLRSRIRVVQDAGDVRQETDSDIDDFDARIPHSDNSDNPTPADSNDSENANSNEPAAEGSEAPFTRST